MDKSHLVPLVDERNPLYCPAISADAYIRSLRDRMAMEQPRNPGQQDRDSYQTYAQLLGRSDDDDESVDDRENTFAMLNPHLTSKTRPGHTFGQSPISEELPPYSPIIVLQEQAHGQKGHNTTTVVQITPAGIKRKGVFSDFEAPPKYARSRDSFHDSSFEIENRHEKLRFELMQSSPEASKALKSKETVALAANDDIGSLIDKLECIYPGIRLKERLENLCATSAQELVDFLGEKGYINEKVLLTFRCAKVTRIVLTSSMIAAKGLNLVGDGIYSGDSVFSTFESFRHLVEISFAYIHLQDCDLAHIHHLPNLAVLDLNETGIGDEGVFLLVPLKGTLTRLILTANPNIGNDAVPAILLLNNLSFLSILDTGIDMPGLRRLAQYMVDHDHIMDIEIPFACEAYVDAIATQYALHLPPPLLSDWKMCGHLSAAALKRNLEAHAACNPSILASGTRAEMLLRLSEILKMRQADILVMEMLNGNDTSLDRSKSVF